MSEYDFEFETKDGINSLILRASRKLDEQEAKHFLAYLAQAYKQGWTAGQTNNGGSISVCRETPYDVETFFSPFTKFQTPKYESGQPPEFKITNHRFLSDSRSKGCDYTWWDKEKKCQYVCANSADDHQF